MTHWPLFSIFLLLGFPHQTCLLLLAKPSNVAAARMVWRGHVHNLTLGTRNARKDTLCVLAAVWCVPQIPQTHPGNPAEVDSNEIEHINGQKNVCLIWLVWFLCSFLGPIYGLTHGWPHSFRPCQVEIGATKNQAQQQQQQQHSKIATPPNDYQQYHKKYQFNDTYKNHTSPEIKPTSCTTHHSTLKLNPWIKHSDQSL